MKTPVLRCYLAFVAFLAATGHSLAQTPQITSWFTQNSGKYSRVYTTTANRSSGTTAPTWNTSGSTLPHTSPSYADVYEVSYSTNWVYVKYAGIPSYVVGPWLNPQGAVGSFWAGTQAGLRRFPRSPAVQSGTKDFTAAGTSGIFVNGVAAFNALDGQAWDGTQIQGGAQHTNGTYYWHRNAPVAESYNFDYSLGHQLPAGLFHNHQNPIALRYQLGDHVDYNSSSKKYTESTTTVTTHSPILGWAHDGYPIYGPYGYSTATSSTSGVRRMVSGYVKRDGTTTGVDTVTSATTTMPTWYTRYRTNHSMTNGTPPARSTDTGTYPIGTFAQDWSYLGDLIKTGATSYAQATDFDLDEYNGRYCVTPEYPSGTYAYFTSIDSNGDATYPYVFGFEFYGNATGGSVTSITETVTTYFTGGPNLPVTFTGTPTASSGSVTLIWNSAEGSTYTVENSTNQSTWNTKATGVAAASNATTTSSAFSPIGSSGTEYGRVTRTALATYDTTGVGSATVTQTGTGTYLAGANTAPTLTTISTLAGATENTAFTLSYTSLAAAADEADADGNAISFRIEAVSSGTLTKNGSSVVAGTTLIYSGDSVVWTPATNASGTLAAFTVKAYDGTAASSTAVTVNVAVTAVNQAPTLTTINTLTGATEDTAFTISYATLAAAADEADADGDAISFRIEAVSSGTLTKNGSSVVAGTTLISTGDSVVWTPAANANGTLAAFTVKAWDGASASGTAVTVNVTATAVNDAPTLTTISTLTGAVKNTAFTITYTALAAAADEADPDGTTPSFRIEAVSSGTLTKSGTAVTAGTTTLASGESVVWTPATNVTGTTAAFTVRAWDGSLASSTAVAVNVTVSASAGDAQLTSWYTTQTGKYARIVETDAQLTADTTETTWTRTSGPNTLAQASPVYAGPQQIDYSTSWVYVRTPSLATYTMGPWYNDAARSTLFVNVPKNQGLIVRFPRSSTLGSIPTTKTQTSGLNIGGVPQPAAGYYVDGVCLFDPTDGFSYSGGTEASPGTGQWHRDAWANEQITFDKSYAHEQNTGVYHNHANPIALRYQLGDNVSFNSTTKVYTEGSTTAVTAHSPIIGWMVDGLPVYGPYGYSSAMDASSGVRRMVGGFVLRDGTTTGVDNLSTGTRTVPAWATRNGPTVSTTYPLGRYVEDYAYLGDLIKTGSTKYQQATDFDLNEFNVRYCVTPEFPSGTWAYFLSLKSDGTPLFPYMVNRWFYGTPTGGAVNSVSETVTNLLSGGANRPLTINSTTVSGTSVTLAWAAVEGGTYSVDASSNNSTWTSKASGLTVSKANTKSNTHTALGTSGTEYARVNRTALATYDTTGTVSATTAQTTTTSFSLGAAEVAPTLTTINTLTGATENTAFSLSYATLAAAADEADANGDAISFRIEAVSSGTLTKNGSSVVAGSTLISSGDSVVWTPATNASGTLAAFTVKAWDGTLASSTAVAVNIAVTAVNQAPTLTAISTLTGATENIAFTISYAALAAAANEADVDGDAISFRIEAVSSGTLTKNGTSVVAGTTLISSGDSVVWTPAPNASGTLAAFTVKAWDGALASSTAVTVNVAVTAVNYAPTLTAISTLTAATEDTAFTISYATLAAAADEADANGDVISFRVEAVSSGTLTKNGSSVVAGTTLISSGDSVVWTPAANANGTLPAFTVKAWDGALASSTAVTVNVSVAAVADGAIWTGGGGTSSWSTALNWIDFSLPLSTDAVQFTGASPLSIDLGANRTVGSMAFSGSGAYTLSNNTLTLGSGGTISTANPGTGSLTDTINSNVALGSTATVNVASAASLALGSVSGSGSMTKTGQGTLILDGTNTHTGTLTISAGTVQFGVSGFILTSSKFASIVNNGALSFTQTDSAVATNISGTGAWSMIGTGGSSSVTYTGTASHTGGTILDGCGLSIGNGGTTGWVSGSLTAVNQTDLFYDHSDDVTMSGTITSDGSVYQGGSGNLTLASTVTAANGWVRGGGKLTLTSTFTARSNMLVGAFGSTGTLAAAGANCQLGINGTLYVAFFGGTGTVQISNGAHVTAADVTLASDNGVASLVISGAGSTLTVSDTVDGMATSTFQITNQGSATVSILNTVPVTLDNGGLTFSGATSNSAPITVNSGGATISNGGDVTLIGAISGTGTLAKTGSGRLTLSGAQSRSGNTTVSAGTLSLDSAGLGDTADVSLASGTALDLDFTGADTVGALYLNGVRQVIGTWGGVASSATNKTSQITGTGILNVTAGTVSFASWAANQGLVGASAGFEADPDNDGVSNGLEFVFGTDPTSSTSGSHQPTTSLGGGYLTLTFNRTDVSEGLVTLLVEYSTDLTHWTSVPVGATSSTSGGVIVSVTENGSAADTVNVSIPVSTNTRMFARVVALQ